MTRPSRRTVPPQRKKVVPVQRDDHFQAETRQKLPPGLYHTAGKPSPALQTGAAASVTNMIATVITLITFIPVGLADPVADPVAAAQRNSDKDIPMVSGSCFFFSLLLLILLVSLGCGLPRWPKVCHLYGAGAALPTLLRPKMHLAVFHRAMLVSGCFLWRLNGEQTFFLAAWSRFT